MIGKRVAEEGTTQALSLFRNAISAPFRDALIAFMAATAQAQAEATKETQRAGIAHAKANGDEGPAMSSVARNCPLCVMKNSPHPWLHGLG